MYVLNESGVKETFQNNDVNIPFLLNSSGEVLCFYRIFRNCFVVCVGDKYFFVLFFKKNIIYE